MEGIFQVKPTAGGKAVKQGRAWIIVLKESIQNSSVHSMITDLGKGKKISSSSSIVKVVYHRRIAPLLLNDS